LQATHHNFPVGRLSQSGNHPRPRSAELFSPDYLPLLVSKNIKATHTKGTNY